MVVPFVLAPIERAPGASAQRWHRRRCRSGPWQRARTAPGTVGAPCRRVARRRAARGPSPTPARRPDAVPV